VKDEDLADVLFLDAHPGWTWDALMSAPENVVEGLRQLDLLKAQNASE
jgi:hypothetical protein